jgi:hypothetical protein
MVGQRDRGAVCVKPIVAPIACARISAVRANLRVRRVCARSGHWAPQKASVSCLRNQDRRVAGVMEMGRDRRSPTEIGDRSRDRRSPTEIARSRNRRRFRRREHPSIACIAERDRGAASARRNVLGAAQGRAGRREPSTVEPVITEAEYYPGG